jgi:hypothetical protein
MPATAAASTNDTPRATASNAGPTTDSGIGGRPLRAHRRLDTPRTAIAFWIDECGTPHNLSASR